MNEDEIMRRNVRQGFRSNPTIDLERKMKNYVSKMVWYIQKIELFEKKLSLSSRGKIFVLFFFDVQMRPFLLCIVKSWHPLLTDNACATNSKYQSHFDIFVCGSQLIVNLQSSIHHPLFFIHRSSFIHPFEVRNDLVRIPLISFLVCRYSKL